MKLIGRPAISSSWTLSQSVSVVFSTMPQPSNVAGLSVCSTSRYEVFQTGAAAT